MNGNCLDIGTIQAFLDGETRPEQAVKISEHIEDCDACTILLAQAEEESSMVFSVLDRELNSLVPTQRLWSRINAEISEEKSRSSVWGRLAAFVTVSLASPSFASAAGILIVFGMVAAVWVMNSGDGLTNGEVAGANAPVSSVSHISEPTVSAAPTLSDATLASVIEAPAERKSVKVTNLSDSEINRMIRANYVVSGPKKVSAVPARAQYLPGEESYVKTINELQETVTAQNAAARPSGEVSFQRDLAVVDDSISKMRKVVKKNPRNLAARQVLYSSYQDKIELLKSSAQRDELMASFQ
jgi:hypothetical protein